MAVHFTQTYVQSKKPNPVKAIWETDDVVKNLKLYVGTSGVKMWYVYYRINGKKDSYKIGPAGGLITPAMAREKAQKIQVDVAAGMNPKEKPTKKLLLGDYLTNFYEPWVVDNLKSGKETMDMIRSAFTPLFNCPVEDIKIMDIERWRMNRLKLGRKKASVNRVVTALKSAINWGFKRGVIPVNPLQRLQPLKEDDSNNVVRYLAEDERGRLMNALDVREKRLRSERESYNKWLEERAKPTLPLLNGEFADYLKPMVLLSLKTGIRRDSLFSLRWQDIDFHAKCMTLRAESNKAGKTQRFELNSVAMAVLTGWKKQSINTNPEALVFVSPVTGKKFDNCNTAWEKLMMDAQIENFRWHDMRHDFASQLVMRGVDLNTVRSLMGHADLKMTLRYAHLAPEKKLSAVEKLEKPLSLE